MFLYEKLNYLGRSGDFWPKCFGNSVHGGLICLVTQSKQSIRIKTSYYFPKTVRAIGAVFGLFGLAMVWTSPILGLLFIFITVVIFTTHYGFEISVHPNYVREYISVLGFYEGKKSPYKAVEFVFIQPGQLRFLTYWLSEKVSDGFEAYIKFDGRNEIMILAMHRKEDLIHVMKGMATRLQVPIRDYTDGIPVPIYEP